MTCVAVGGGRSLAGFHLSRQTNVICTPPESRPTLRLHAQCRSGSRLFARFTLAPIPSSREPLLRIQKPSRQQISPISSAILAASHLFADHSPRRSNAVRGFVRSRISQNVDHNSPSKVQFVRSSLPNAGVDKPPTIRAPPRPPGASRIVEPSNAKPPVPDAVDPDSVYGADVQLPPSPTRAAISDAPLQLQRTQLSQTPQTPLVREPSEPSGVGNPKPSGSLLGAVALITGTSVGAGILALPGISAPAGFIPATSIMVGCWGFLVGEALLLAEVNVELLKSVVGEQNRASDVLSLRTMAQKTLGATGGAAATLAYVFLTYALLVRGTHPRSFLSRRTDPCSLFSRCQ